MAINQSIYTFYSKSPSSERLHEYINLINLKETDEFVDLEPLYFSGDRKIVLSNIDVLLVEEVFSSLHEEKSVVIALIQDLINYIFRDTIYNTKNFVRDTSYYELFPVFIFENEKFLGILNYLIEHNQIKLVLNLLEIILLRFRSYEEKFLAPKKSDYFVDKWYTKIPHTPIRSKTVSIEDEVFAWLDYQDGESNIHPDVMYSPYINIADEYDTVYDVDGPYFSDVRDSTFVAAQFIISKLKKDKSMSDLEKYLYLKQLLNYVASLKKGSPSGEQELYYLVFNEYLELEKQKKSKDFNNYTKLAFPNITLESRIEKSKAINDNFNRVYLNNQWILDIEYSSFGLSKESYVNRIIINTPIVHFEEEAFHILSYICLQELHLALPLNFFEGAKKWILQISEDEEYPSIEVWDGIAVSYIDNKLIIERHIEQRYSIKDLPFGL